MNNKILLCLLIIVICLHCFNNNHITEMPIEKREHHNPRAIDNFQRFPLEINENNVYIIRVNIGSREQSMRLKLTTLRNGLFLMGSLDQERVFKPRESSTYYMIEERKINNESGIIIADTVKFYNTDIKMSNYKMFVIEEKSIYSTHYEGFLGFALKENNSENKMKNLASFLLEKNLISGNKISVTHLSSNSGVLTIGDIPNEIKENKKKYKTCPLGQNQEDWNCKLSGIYFEDGTLYPINDFLGISLGGNIFHVPKRFFDYFIDKYFTDEIFEGVCNVKLLGGFSTLCCKKNYNSKPLPNLSIIIGKWNMKFSIADSFYVDDEVTGKVCSSVVHQNDEWFISPSIMPKYTIVLDKDNTEIGFFKGN